jgi:hypothetical protein
MSVEDSRMRPFGSSSKGAAGRRGGRGKAKGKAVTAAAAAAAARGSGNGSADGTGAGAAGGEAGERCGGRGQGVRSVFGPLLRPTAEVQGKPDRQPARPLQNAHVRQLTPARPSLCSAPLRQPHQRPSLPACHRCHPRRKRQVAHHPLRHRRRAKARARMGVRKPSERRCTGCAQCMLRTSTAPSGARHRIGFGRALFLQGGQTLDFSFTPSPRTRLHASPYSLAHLTQASECPASRPSTAPG